MASMSEQIANICDLGQLNTELIAMNLRRSSQDNKQINQHLQSAEFARRAEILEPESVPIWRGVGLCRCERSATSSEFRQTSLLPVGSRNSGRLSAML